MNNQHVFRRLLGYLKKYRLRLCMVLVFAGISTIFMVLAPFVIGEITTTLFASIQDGRFYWKTIGTLLLILIGLYFISQIFSLLQGFGMAKITAGVMETLRQDIDDKMHRLKLEYYDTHTHGDILSVITNDVDTINNTMSQNLTAIVTQAVTAAGIFLMMVSISPKLSVIPIILVPLSLLSAAKMMKLSGTYYNRQQQLLGTLNGYIEEIYHGHQVVQTFHYQKRAQAAFEELNEQLCQSAFKAETTAGAVTPITTVVNDVGYVLCAGLGCIGAIAGRIAIGNVQAMLEYTRKFAEPFSSIAGMAGSFGAAAAAGKRIFALLDAEEEIPESNHCVIPQNCKGSVSFQNVAFGYTPDSLLMKGIDVTIKPGQKVAIVGPTGAGKTTLINLLMRFYEINSGKILVDGVDIREMGLHDLRERIGYVPQKGVLFSGTIDSNIRYGKEDATKEEVNRAAEIAQAQEFIGQKEKGMESEIAQGGTNVSGGQKQRLSIARAIAKNPEIYIFDDSFSALDYKTDVVLRRALKKETKDATTLIVAQRISTILHADKILVLDEGKIVGEGTHKELLKTCEVYQQIAMSQLSKEELEHE